MDITSHLYTIVSGQGFGPTQPQCHYGAPLPCATYEPAGETRYRSPSMARVYLGVTPPREDWIHNAKAASLLVLQGGDTRDAEKYGYAVLNLWPLDGVSAVLTIGGTREVHVGASTVIPQPSPEVAALLVGKAIAGAWDEHPRIVAYGPTWATDILAAIPGAVVYTPRYHRNDEGTCTAWGRSWAVNYNGPNPFQVAQRLSWTPPLGFIAEERAIGSLLLGGYRKEVRVQAVVEGKDHWRVDHPELGSILIHATRRYNNEPVARWPSADDQWLVDLVGDGELLETDEADGD